MEGCIPFYLRDDNAEQLRAATAITVLVEKAFCRSSERPRLSPFDYAVLRHIAQFDKQGARRNDIVRAFNLSLPSVATLIYRLIRLGLITDEPSAGRRSPHLARLTENGWRALASDPLHKALADLFSNIDADGCRGLFEALIRSEFAQARWRALGFGVDFWR